MAKKNICDAQIASTALRSNYVLMNIGGSLRQISIDNLMNVMNSGDEQLLRQVAWGVPINQNASSPNWGRVGNLSMWEEYKSMVGRYLVTNDGNAAKLNPARSDVFADGTTLDETKGHVMVIAPKLYYVVKEDPSSGKVYLWMSMLPIGGHFIGDCNNGEHICVAAYKGSMSGSALVSRSGVAPAGNKTISAFWNAAQVNGKDWGLVNYDQKRYLVMLGLSEYGNPNIQDKIGYGIGGSSALDLWSAAAGLVTGATISLGDNNGNIPISVVNGANTGVNCSRVNMLGWEDLWGWQWEMTQGCYFGNSANTGQDGTEMYLYEGNRMPSDAELATFPAGNYRQAVRFTGSGNYVKTMLLGEYFDIMPTALGGGSTSYWCDYYWGNTTGQLLLWGGDAHSGSYCGLASVDSYPAFSYSDAYCGSRLAYYGKLTFMSGKQLMAAA